MKYSGHPIGFRNIKLIAKCHKDNSSFDFSPLPFDTAFAPPVGAPKEVRRHISGEGLQTAMSVFHLKSNDDPENVSLKSSFFKTCQAFSLKSEAKKHSAAQKREAIGQHG